jgi:hypothetical protein
MTKIELTINDFKIMKSKDFAEDGRLLFSILTVYVPCIVDLDSSVSKATRYGLDGPGIESRWG